MHLFRFEKESLILKIGVFAAFLIFPVVNTHAADIKDITIHGYMDLEYNKADNSQGNNNGSFDSRHFNLLFDFPINERLIVKSHIEFEHGVDTKNGFGKVQLEYAFFEFTLSDIFKFRGGKTLTPFGLFNEVRDAAPAYMTVRIPTNLYSASKRGGFEFFPEYNTGLGLLGLYQIGKNDSVPYEIDYAFQLGNGEGLETTNPFSSDDNGNKSLSSRFNLHIKDTATIGLSFYTGDKAISETIDAVHNTISALFVLHNSALDIISEAARTEFAGTRETAVYVQVSYTIFDDYAPYYRYEHFDPSSITNDSWQSHIIGLNCHFAPNIVLKIEHNFHERGENNKLVSNGQTKFKEINAAIAISF